MESQKKANQPLCANGCGRYGLPQNQNLCSNCFEEQEKEEMARSAEPANAPAVPAGDAPVGKNIFGPQASVKYNGNGLNFSFGRNNGYSFSPSSSSYSSSVDGLSKKPGGNPFSFGGSTKGFSFSSASAATASGNTMFLSSPQTGAASKGGKSFSFGCSTRTSLVKRCSSCSKRVGLMGFNCRCGNLFCGKHRYPEEHHCSFDFKGAGREILFKENPVIRNNKLGHRI